MRQFMRKRGETSCWSPKMRCGRFDSAQITKNVSSRGSSRRVRVVRDATMAEFGQARALLRFSQGEEAGAVRFHDGHAA